MILRDCLVAISTLSLLVNSIYLYHTEDQLSADYIDCIYYQDLAYCRRFPTPQSVQRDNVVKPCSYNGTLHTFMALLSNNISFSTVLHQWRSSIERAEQYARYIQQPIKTIEDNEKYLCQCIHPQTFGKFCEYLLPIEDSTFQATVQWQFQMKFLNKENVEKYGDILCYTTLVCDFGLLCLDWRDICDGIQQCMYGLDEENCDLLEFNECEDDEYRCMNGMCIPDEFFVDGDYDCMDFTDEKNLFNDINCSFEQVHLECDDRICLRNQWSCGDGQCILNRFIFQRFFYDQHECSSRRDQYYMCETSAMDRQWTLPNGRCDRSNEYQQLYKESLSLTETCIYFFKCHLTDGAEKDCPCRYDGSCFLLILYWCPDIIFYPNGGIIAPYLLNKYLISDYKDGHPKMPFSLRLNGTIKCRGFQINQLANILYFFPLYLRDIEADLCTNLEGIYTVLNGGYDRDCYNGSMTLNKQLYRFIDVCKQSKECISAYRIKDGIQNCADGMDENTTESIVEMACSHLKRHRFRCSIDEPTCFFVHVLGDTNADCKNKKDEIWMHTTIPLSEIKCDRQVKKDCQLIRQYIEASWNTDTDILSSAKSSTTKISFRRYCDTFYDLGSKKDEALDICKKWWKCLDEQWQCNTGQCIDVKWVLDNEWDCVDASDEESIFIYDHALSPHNLKLINQSVLMEKFRALYDKLAFFNVCNLSTEYPCFRTDVSYLSVNMTHHNRPCIRMEQLGDGQIDCIGGQDERNTIQHCVHPTTLGQDFMCLKSRTCISKSAILCESQCSDPSDNLFECQLPEKSVWCISDTDTYCLNGTCIRNGRCNRIYDCLYGEDEYMCQYKKTLIGESLDLFYREKKRQQTRGLQSHFHLPQIPSYINYTSKTDLSNFSEEQTRMTVQSVLPIDSRVSYVCNRGVGMFNHRGIMICFCPPQYYGVKCEFHNDRLTVIFHLNLSQSNYMESNNPRLVLKLLVLFLFENQTLDTHEFHIRPALESAHPQKLIHHFVYSRSNDSLENKRMRYFQRSKLVHEHPYTIRIECYEMNVDEKAHLIGIWQYPIYFDYLPSFRLSKILRLIQSDPVNNPCSSNPCSLFEECHQLQNQRSAYICLCPTNFMGPNCSVLDAMCASAFCSADSLCKPSYRSLLNGNDRPYCICSLNTFGRQCYLMYDSCVVNPCQNNGTCLTTDQPKGFLCICNNEYYGTSCELKKNSISLYFSGSIIHRGVVVQYFKFDLTMLDVILVSQRVFLSLPDVLLTLYDDEIVPQVILIKFYLLDQIKIYLVFLQFNFSTSNVIIDLSDKSECMPVTTLWTRKEEISPIQYHSICFNNSALLCFHDNDYVCICSEQNVRVECFGYDHSLERCSRCLAGGQCLQENYWKSRHFVCVCPVCYRGSVCQFNSEIQSFSLDSLFAEMRFEFALSYLILTILIFVVGGLTNYASFVTFQRPKIRKYGVGKSLLLNCIISQCALVALLGKTVQNLFRFLLNPISCKIISYMLSVFTRCSFWLISWVTVERLLLVLFPHNSFLKKSCFTLTVIVVTCLILLCMHVHDLIFYNTIEDINGQLICVADFTPTSSNYNRITLFIHYLVPFFIQIVSITLLIICIARSHSKRSTTRTNTFYAAIKDEFIGQKELYITPLVMILSSLPQVVLSFIFACTELSIWQQHLLLTAYFLSYTPQLLGFFIFVLSSTTYLSEFRQTQLAGRFFFKRFLLKN